MENGSKGVQAAKAGQIDLVIMDVGLPDIDGHEAVRILRKNGFKAPIIMLTGHDTDSDTILGLDSGADDYITKPFRFAVLLARIRAQLRQHETSEDAVFTIGPYAFLHTLFERPTLDWLHKFVPLRRRRPFPAAVRSRAAKASQQRRQKKTGVAESNVKSTDKARSN